MNLHTITTLFVILGFSLTLFCIVEAEVCYRQVSRYLERSKAKGEDAGERDGG